MANWSSLVEIRRSSWSVWSDQPVRVMEAATGHCCTDLLPKALVAAHKKTTVCAMDSQPANDLHRKHSRDHTLVAAAERTTAYAIDLEPANAHEEESSRIGSRSPMIDDFRGYPMDLVPANVHGGQSSRTGRRCSMIADFLAS